MADPRTCPRPLSIHKDCDACSEHYLTEESLREGTFRRINKLNDRQAQSLLRKHLKDTEHDLQHVRDVLLSHGDVILSRWKKYSQDKRAKLLGTASMLFSPVMATVREATQLRQGNAWGTKRSCMPLFPWAEPDAFAQDSMKLLSLLHVRSEYAPSRWAALDTQSTWRMCIQESWEEYTYNVGAVVMYGEQYGTLVDFNVNAAHGLQRVGFPRAIATFIVQKTIAAMLSAAVDLLVVDAEPSGNSKWTALLSGGLHSAGEEALWSSYYHPHFAPPPRFDPDIVLTKARNHLNILVDELELMLTNPEHMRQYVLEIKASTRYDANEE